MQIFVVFSRGTWIETIFYFESKVSEEGKTGRDLAAAKFINKLKFGAEVQRLVQDLH